MGFMRAQNERFEKMQTQLNNDLKNTLADNKSLLQKLTDKDNRLLDVQRKYDDSKRNYYKLKEQYEKLRLESKAAGGKPEDPGDGLNSINGGMPVAQKYEQLKVKYRVSISSFILS